MNKLNKLVYLCSIIVILMLVMFEYAYSAPAHFFDQYQSVVIDPGQIDSAAEKTELIDLSGKYQINILFNQLQINDKTEYIVYSTEPISLPKFPQMYKTMENKKFSDLESSILYKHELFMEKTPELNQLIEELTDMGMSVELNQQYVGNYTISKTTILILALTLILNGALILITFNSNLKSYGVSVLEGYSITKIMFKESIATGLFIFGFAIIISILIFIFQQPEVYVYKWFLKLTLLYIALIISCKQFTTQLFKYESIKDYLKGYNRSNRPINFLLVLKVITFVYLTLTIPLMFQALTDIKSLNEQIDSYSKFDNIVVSQEYSSSLSSYFDDESFLKAESNYYINTVDEFNGVLYYITANQEAAVNYNALEFIDILDANGNVLTEADLNPYEETHLVTESQMGALGNDYDNVVAIKDDQEFLSIELNDLSQNKMVVPKEIVYYPREMKDVLNSNLGVIISKSGYFLNVPGEDKYETLKPYIEKSNAEGIIVSAPGVTVYMKENLTYLIQNVIGQFYILLLSIITVLIITMFSISSYIKLNTKSIVVKTLEGVGIFGNLKIIYLALLLEIFISFLLVVGDRANLIPSLVCIIIEFIITSVLSKKLLRQNLSEFMKGNQ